MSRILCNAHRSLFAVRCSLAAAIVLFLASNLITGTEIAHAAGATRSPVRTHATSGVVKVGFSATGGGCDSIEFDEPPLHIGSCISENSSQYIVPDAYIHALNETTGWAYCDISIALFDATSSVTYPGQNYNCLNPLENGFQGHYYGPVTKASIGDYYYAETFWEVIYGSEDFEDWVDSPNQYT